MHHFESKHCCTTYHVYFYAPDHAPLLMLCTTSGDARALKEGHNYRFQEHYESMYSNEHDVIEHPTF